MLELNNLSLGISTGNHPPVVLHEICAQFPLGHFTAITGSSAPANRALLRTIAGIYPPSKGEVRWKGAPGLSLGNAGAVGYVCAADLAHGYLTPNEVIDQTFRMRVAPLDSQECEERTDKVLMEVGLVEVADDRIQTLTCEQIFRLNLAIELVISPKALLCESLPRELDPKAETKILKLLRRISDEQKCLVLLVIEDLHNLNAFDALMVLHEGHLAYHGPGEFLFHYFNVQSSDELLPRLAKRKALEWHASWKKHSHAYYAAQTDGYAAVKRSDEEPDEVEPSPSEENPEFKPEEMIPSNGAPAGIQLRVLLSRHWKSLVRNRVKLLWMLCLIFALPCLVIVFSWGDLARLVNAYANSSKSVGPGSVGASLSSLASGLTMFQVILLGYAGAINGASQIAGERMIFEKEKRAGLRPGSYIASKAVVIITLAAAQTLWMTYFVKSICHFPESYWLQAGFLLFVNTAVSSLSLAISAFSESKENAKLTAILFASVQFPLTGTVLALPEEVIKVVRWADPAYWGWAGYLNTFGSHHYAATAVSIAACLGVLAGQIVFGLGLAWIGARRNRWDIQG